MPKLMKPSFSVVCCTPDMLDVIEDAARKCYLSEPKKTVPAEVTGEDVTIKQYIARSNEQEKFIADKIALGHHSVLEHGNITVDFVFDRGCCYDDKTEVLTKEGWKSFKDVTTQDYLAGMSDEGVLVWDLPSELQVVPYSGELLRFHTTNIDLLVTPNHKMWVMDYDKRAETSRVWKFLRADELVNNRYTFTKRVHPCDGTARCEVVPEHQTKRLQYPALKFNAYETAHLFELLGLWVTDGSYRNGKGTGSCIVITQTKPKVVERIHELCTLLGFKCTHFKNELRIDNLRLLKYVELLFGEGAKSFTCRVPNLIKEASLFQLTSFITGVMLGDGNQHKSNNHRVVYTSSKLMADDLQECFLRVGVSANIRTIAPRTRVFPSGKESQCKESYIVSVSEERRSNPLLDKRGAKEFGTKIVYEGNVYCATVPTHRLYVRRNGIPVWCGNSHEEVRHRLQAISQESTRYCNYSKEKYGNEIAVIDPFYFDKKDTLADVDLPDFGELCMVRRDGDVFCRSKYMNKFDVWFLGMQLAEWTYLQLIAMGASAQEARSVLPNSLKTEMRVTMNVREWRHVLSIRTAAGVHPQMAEVMVPCLASFQDAWPVLFGDISHADKWDFFLEEE